MSNLAQRVLFGSIGAAILFSCIWYSAWTFAVFFALVQARMLWEFYRMMKKVGYAPAAGIGITLSILVFVGLAYAYNLRASVNDEAIAALRNLGKESPQFITASTYQTTVATLRNTLGGLVLVLPVVFLLREMVLWPRHQRPFANAGVALLGLLYVSVPMGLLNVLTFTDHGYDYRRVLALLLLVWAADIGAYFAGKAFGRHKLAPNISPGKTWEGWVGGSLLTLAMAWVLGYLLPDLPLAHRLVAAGIVAVFGVLGDLAESMLKRSVDVKDSGRFLPGHGGLLDRFDAFLFILPVLVLVQMLFG